MLKCNIYTIVIVNLDDSQILLCETFTSKQSTFNAADAFLREYGEDNGFNENELTNELIDDPDVDVIFKNSSIQINVFSGELLC